MSDCDREESPDWLRSFQAPTKSVLTLSSASESSISKSPVKEEENNDIELSTETTSQFHEDDKGQTKPSKRSTAKELKKEQFPVKEEENNDIELSTETSQFHEDDKGQTKPSKRSTAKELKKEQSPVKKKVNKGDLKGVKREKSNFEAPISSAWVLSSDSDSPTSPKKESPKGKSPRKGKKTKDTVPKNKEAFNSDDIKKEGVGGGVEAVEEDITEKHIESRFSSSRLPLVISDKVSRSKALVECEGDSIDLSGDVGAVGRVVVSDDMLLDLKGTIYKATIVPSRTFCVVSFGPSEAKIEAIMNDFIQLKPQSNVYEAETMVEGTLDGYLFDSDDEADRVPKAATDQNEENGEKSNAKPGKKKAEKTTGVVRKRGKPAAGKAPKKAKTKAHAPKKGKSKK